MKGLTTVALSLVALGFVCAGFVNTSCQSNSDGDDDGDDDGTNPDGGHQVVCGADGGEGGTTLSYAGPAGETCVAPAGQIPEPACDQAWQPGSAPGVEALCNTTPTTCNLSKCPVSVDPSSCEPLTQNPSPDGGVLNFRMRRLIVVSPPNLASETIQNTVVTSGVDMNEVACGEIGTGAFSWILSLDTGNKTIKTGGAPPCDIPNPTNQTPGTWSCDPFNTGYCFVNKMVGNIPVAPVSAAAHQNCDDTWSTDQGAIGTVNIPIYYQGSIIVLPIRGGTMEGVTVSADGNCIGNFNPTALASDCSDHYDECSKWKNDGSITGFITLEDSDKVKVDLLHESLCVILTGATAVQVDAGGGTTYGYCPRNADGSIAFKGDYCSTPGTTGAPGSCQDSFWLSATFAASAVKLNDGSASGPNGGPNVDCLGTIGVTPDAGVTTDASTPATDAATASDASAD